MTRCRLTTHEAAQLGEAITGKRRSKYGSVWTEVDGLKFQSKKEANRWGELRLLERRGVIRGLRRQVRYSLVGQMGEHVCYYVADSAYEEQKEGAWQSVVEDVKSPPTRKKETYRIKRELFRQQYGLSIRET